MTRNTVILCTVLIIVLAMATGRERLATPTAMAQTYPFQSGFPRFEARNTISFASPTVVDLDQDGLREILTADGNGCVWAWEHTGELLPNFPLRTAGSCQGTPRISGPLALGDVDGDGELEIAAGTRGSGEAAGERGKIFLWNRDGSLLSGWPREMAWNRQYGSGLPEVLTVAMANVTGDARLEIIAGTSNNSSDGGDPDLHDTHNLYVMRADGTVLPGFPTQYRRAGIWGFVGAADLTGDGFAEIVTGRDHAFVHAYSPQGEQLPGWPVSTRVDPGDPDGLFMEFTREAASMGDLDGDGEIEIVIAGKVRDPRQDREVTNSAVLVLLPNGQRKPGWEVAPLGGAPLADTYPPTQAPALADLDGDGNLEIVVSMLDGKIRAFAADGSPLWTYNFAGGARLYGTEPVVGDVTGNGHPDVLFGTYSPDGSADGQIGLYGLNHQGNPLAGFPLPLTEEDNASKRGMRAAPTLTDLDKDCDVEIVAASRAGVLYVWDAPASYSSSRMAWPTARHDFQRTGFVGAAGRSTLPDGGEAPAGYDQRLYLPISAHLYCEP